ncbi:hypothetical protein [Oxalicibacterium sp.]|uniref:hypothetical protein n=1 Tax=Oxalicibacterium sp. TaxID=2766525 RepID=UPI002D7F5777|nr:hypothetical protein [Oxalicibacterium sp.]
MWMVMPLATLLSEKFADRFGHQQSPTGRVVIQSLIFIVTLLPTACVVLTGSMLLLSSVHILFGAH